MVDFIQFYITFFIKTKTSFGYSLTQYLEIDVKTLLPTKTLCYVIIICWFLISGKRQFNLLIS